MKHLLDLGVDERLRFKHVIAVVVIMSTGLNKMVAMICQ
jgi:hypothetical protein